VSSNLSLEMHFGAEGKYTGLFLDLVPVTRSETNKVVQVKYTN